LPCVSRICSRESESGKGHEERRGTVGSSNQLALESREAENAQKAGPCRLRQTAQRRLQRSLSRQTRRGLSLIRSSSTARIPQPRRPAAERRVERDGAHRSNSFPASVHGRFHGSSSHSPWPSEWLPQGRCNAGFHRSRQGFKRGFARVASARRETAEAGGIFSRRRTPG